MRASLLVAALTVAGCGGSGRQLPPPPTLAADPGYPAGPYGYSEGQVLADLQLDGKLVPVGSYAAQHDGAAFSLGGLRSPDRRFFVIESVGRWCDDCQGDQQAMMQLEADYADKGVFAMEMMSEGAFDVAPTANDLDAWSQDWDASGLLLLDGNRSVEYAGDINAFPTYFIVDATTMTIVKRTTDTLLAAPLGPTLDALLAQ